MLATMELPKIIALLREEIQAGRSPTLADVARTHGFSPWHFSREFKRTAGFSLRQFAEATKIQHSIDAVSTRRLSVTHSAHLSGYASLGTFSNAFRRHTGISAKRFHQETQTAISILRKLDGKTGTLYHHEYPNAETAKNRLKVTVHFPDGYVPAITCVGLFPTAIPKGPPVVGAALFHHTSVTLHNIPAGAFYLLACDLTPNRNYIRMLQDNYRQKGPRVLHFPTDSDQHFELAMRLRQPEDPPITMNFPVLIANIVRSRLQQRNSE